MKENCMQKKSTPIDQHVGSRIRLRRMTVGMSQEKLGDCLGVTFQQVQKYEKGVNRVGASRLQRISEVLNAPISFFFEEAPATFDHQLEVRERDSLSKVLASKEFLSLTNSFSAIRDPKIRQKIIDLVDALAATDPDAGDHAAENITAARSDRL
ncbi:helix-turn-helix domain-containing protein [Rhizobium sp. C4]|nr:helix-turn-helix transcriptional regulator [Rhizobium sp. C4]MCD2173645.1 helix-turn-helix domain-containing protein [Rhizobium sp. C4]